MSQIFEYPLVTLITVNYNSARVTMELLDSLKVCSYPNLEIIVVDNGSDQPFQCSMEGIKVMRSEKNLGFAGGNNLGIKAAAGKHILLLNNDTEVEPGFLEPMVELMESREDIGLISPGIIFHNSNNVLQYAGCTEINPITTRGFAIGHKQPDGDQFRNVHQTARAHGAAMLIRGDVIKKVGFLPEVYFLYYEEMDYCEMVKRAGFKIFYMGKSRVYHKESMSVGKLSPLKAYYMNRNRWLYARRNGSVLEGLLSSAYLLTLVYPKNILRHAFNKEWKHAMAVIKAVMWNVINYRKFA